MPTIVNKEDIKQVFPGKRSIPVVRKLEEYLQDDYKDLEEIMTLAVFIIAGGVLRAALTDTKINDIDIYPKTQNDAQIIENELKRKDWEIQRITTCVIFKKNGKTIQVMNRYTGEPNEILSKFDFTICMAAWQPGTGIFYFYKKFDEDLKEKELIFNTNAEYPIRSIRRTYKYIDYGFWISTMDLLAIVLKTWYLNLEDDAVIEDQLFFYTEDNYDLIGQIHELRDQCRPRPSQQKLDLLEKLSLNRTVENIKLNKCATCGKNMKGQSFRNRASLKEFRISGMCQECQDDFFGKD